MVGRVISPNSVLHFINNLQHGVSSPFSRIGVCVSGGADSMVMAYLLKQIEQSRSSEVKTLDTFGFIVDHKARSESTEEAHLVSENLRSLGIGSEILTMSWPQGLNPLQLSDFESQARAKRYELLASAALRHQIKHLFLGHHQDDQVETILMRLIRNQNTSLKGLAGMTATSTVPTSFDTLGVHTANRGLLLPARGSFPPTSKFYERRREVLFQQILPGGVKLQRPLLTHSKADILATCEAQHIPYVEDVTNKDPTTSLRNAVRYLRKNYQLPQALSTERILRLQQSARHQLHRIESVGKTVLSSCEILLLDRRSGVLQVRLPPTVREDVIDNQSYAYAIAKLTEVVTPSVRVNPNTKIPSHFLTYFWNQNCLDQSEATSTSSPKTFSYDGIQFTQDSAQPQTWTLSRQLMRGAETVDNTRTFTAREPSSSKTKSSNWVLWDNRYWIRVSVGYGDSLDDLVIRPLQPDDMAIVHNQPDADRTQYSSITTTLLRQLKQAAPDKIRYTLPILTYKNQVVAFPTFDVRLQHMLRVTGLSWLEWQVCYNSFSLVDMLKSPTNKMSYSSFMLNRPFETRLSNDRGRKTGYQQREPK